MPSPPTLRQQPRQIGTAVHTPAEAAELSGLTERTVRAYCYDRVLERDVDYVVRWRAAGIGRRRKLLLLTKVGVFRLVAQQYRTRPRPRPHPTKQPESLTNHAAGPGGPPGPVTRIL